MEQHIKKEHSLNRFFMIFLAHAVLTFLFVIALWVCLLTAAVISGLIVPANAEEQAVSDWQASLDGHTAIAPEDIPEGVSYAFFDADGTLLETDLGEDALGDAKKLVARDSRTNIWRNGPRICLRIDTDTQCVVVCYRLIASFRPPLLQRIFPNAELFFFLLLLFLLIADFILISLRYARKLDRELQKLAAAADQISQQNLVFDIPRTNLSEFNRIMDSLKRLKTDLQHSLKEQWSMEQQKKRRLTALAHDIKTPLAIVTGNAELLSETQQTDEQKEYTAFILDHARQIHRYVTAMLELSGTDAPSDSALETPDGVLCGPHSRSAMNDRACELHSHSATDTEARELHPHSATDTEAYKLPSCPIKELLSASARDIEMLRKNKCLSCSLEMQDLPDTLPLPEDKLRRILSNLIDNAVEYSPENGTVFLRAYIADNALHLCVQDEGEGFSGEALALAADEFYRGDPARSSREHFGLGLSIVNRIAGELNGTLRFENAPAKGALVTVVLPLASLNSRDAALLHPAKNTFGRNFSI